MVIWTHSEITDRDFLFSDRSGYMRQAALYYANALFSSPRSAYTLPSII